jgi:SAM-dependent methyltransferase
MYENIYEGAARIPGYNRYLHYAAGIRAQHDPLGWLAQQEDAYRVAQTWLESRESVGSVLELGSGLGYLTFALRKSGYDAVGVDISEEAVSAARRRYSDPQGFYTVSEIEGSTSARFDVVIALEVVEHVDDPVSFVRAAMDYVQPGGALIMSTPNRDAFDASTIWESDAPPVHLTWFGSAAMAALAREVGADLEIVPLEKKIGGVLPMQGSNTVLAPLLSRDGLPTHIARRWTTRWLGRAEALVGRVPKTLRRGRAPIVGAPRPWIASPTSTTLGVAFYKRG